MALGTVTIIRREEIESLRRVIAKIAVSNSSYTTGGELVTPASVGLQSIRFLEVIGESVVFTKHVRVDNTNPTAPKLLIGVEDGTSGIEAQAAGSSDQSAVVVLVSVYGD